MDERQPAIPSPLVGDGLPVPCVDGRDRPYLNLDSAASANALPAVARRRAGARRRFVECGPEGTFSPDDVVAALDASPRPKLLAITGASNVTGWLPPLDAILAAAREREIPVVVDAAQLAPHRPLPPAADYIA